MLGYTYKDIQKMITSLTAASNKAPESGYKDNIEMAIDFFEGLLAEGYVQGESY